MHRTALRHGQLFFETYLKDLENPTIVDVGALDVEGSLRSVAPRKAKYIGVDFAAGSGEVTLLQHGAFEGGLLRGDDAGQYEYGDGQGNGSHAASFTVR